MGSFGEDLRRERESRGVSLREIAEATKVNVRYLEALERDEFDLLPKGPFGRGVVRAYARHLRLDEQSWTSGFVRSISGAGSAVAELPPPAIQPAPQPDPIPAARPTLSAAPDPTPSPAGGGGESLASARPDGQRVSRVMTGMFWLALALITTIWLVVARP